MSASVDELAAPTNEIIFPKCGTKNATRTEKEHNFRYETDIHENDRRLVWRKHIHVNETKEIRKIASAVE